MSTFSVKSNKNNYHIFVNGIGTIGPIINDNDTANAICNWLNSSNLAVNSYSFFSFDVSDINDNIHFILDNHKKVGNPVKSRKDAVAITNICNNSTKELKDILNKKSYAAMTGEEPTTEEINNYMKTNAVGYYIALEQLRQKKYKKL